ncbi:Uncharacterised protein [uncultured archaeon]|nr:Uncharacterised protein [uncultured archaeon]
MKLLKLLVLVALLGLGTAQATDVIISGTVPSYVSISVTRASSSLTPSPMIPDPIPYIGGDNLLVKTNCPYQINTGSDPSSGYMHSVLQSTSLHNPMWISMNSHDPFSLDDPQPISETFAMPSPTTTTIPVTFSQKVTYADRPATDYQIGITFTISPV